MDIIIAEMKKCINNDYTDEEVRLNDEANRELENIMRNLEKNKLDVDMLPKLKELMELYKRKKIDAQNK